MTSARKSFSTENKRSGARVTLPAQLKILFITTLDQPGTWLREAFAADGATRLDCEETVGATAGLARLREAEYDVIVVFHQPGVLDGLDLVEGLRAAGNDLPILLLGKLRPDAIDSLAYEVGADDYCSIQETTVRGLLWKFARALERTILVRENARLRQAERHRLSQEHGETQKLLDHQRQLIADLEAIGQGDAAAMTDTPARLEDCLARSASEMSATPLDLPESLVNHYRELLKAHIIMGVGNLGTELVTLGEMLTQSGVSAQRTLQLHLTVLEELVTGLGSRGARHVMHRADLLVLEVLGHLADGYRTRLHERRNPARQLTFLDFAGANSASSSHRHAA